MKQLIILALTLVTAQSAYAQSGWTGFKRSNEPDIPKPIQKASESVFRIFFPGAPFEIVDLSDPAKLDSVIEQYNNKNWEMLQLGYCRVQGIAKCPVSAAKKLGGGSAYIVRDKKTVATNLHNLQPWISMVAANNGWKTEDFKEKLGEIVVPVLLIDQNEQPVFTASEALTTGEAYRIKVINDDPRLYAPSVNPRQFGFALSDYVELEFKNDFKVPSLPMATSSVADLYFVIGFPGPTNIFAKQGLVDADGIHQMVSTGSRSEIELPSNPGSMLAQIKYFTRITAPTFVGNSGGPVLNARGEVVGILSSGDLERQINGKPAYYSEFINTGKLDDLQKTWKTGQP